MKLNKVKAVLISMAGMAVLGTMTTVGRKAAEAVPASEEAAVADGLVAGVSSISKAALAEYEQAGIVKNDLEKTRAAADEEEGQEDTEQENQETEEQKIEELKIDELNIEEQSHTEDDREEQSVTEAIQEPELVIATVDNYVNIRDHAGMDGEVIGKLYDHSVGTLLEETEDGWYRISSGSVDGYVKAEYVLRGEEGQALADEVGKRLATVTTVTLKVRMEPGTDAKVLGLVPLGDTLAVSEEVDGWVKVSVEEGEGYVSTEYVDVYTENVHAESKEEEEERLAQEEAERRQAAESAAREIARQRAAEEEQKRQAAEAERQRQAANSRSLAGSSDHAQASGTQTKAASSASGGQSQTQASQPAKTPAKQPEPAASTSSAGASLGSSIASYGLQFVGNPYVYGGTSLTNGTDCSGFVQSVYAHFGISLPRTSGEQGRCGSAVAGIENALPGDLIWYSGHIGIYIGNGQIVHASNPSSGIKVSSATYRSILSIRRIV